MKAMILAAGRGERLRPLTDSTPKPLIEVAGKPLIHYHLEKLQQLGIKEVVINQGWLAEQLPTQLGDGRQWGLKIHYSFEGWPCLDTGGGIYKALPHFGYAPFLLINGDVWSEYDLQQLPNDLGDKAAYLILVDNPPHNPKGDFGLDKGKLSPGFAPRLTYSGMGLYHARLFEHIDTTRFSLAPVLQAAMQQGLVSGEHSRAYWQDVGTLERLQALETRLQALETRLHGN